MTDKSDHTIAQLMLAREFKAEFSKAAANAAINKFWRQMNGGKPPSAPAKPRKLFRA